MADKRITQLDELISPNGGDVFAMVNDGVTKKIQHSNYATDVRNLNTPLTGSSLIINNSTYFSGSVVHTFKTLTDSDNPYTVQDSDYMLFVDTTNELTINLPEASTVPGRVLRIRPRHDSSKAVLTRAGSDTIDDGGDQNTVDINGGKSRTIISNGNGIWYTITSTGA